MSPIPPDWPHLDAILPTVDQWAQKTAQSKRAAYALLRFADRLDEIQRARWLVPWLAKLVELHAGDEDFWAYGSLGDHAAGLVKPLEQAPTETRREVRRILSVIADAGSLGAREILGNFVAARGSRTS